MPGHPFPGLPRGRGSVRLGEVQARGPQWSCGQSPWHKATEGSPGLLPRGGLWNIRCPCPPGGVCHWVHRLPRTETFLAPSSSPIWRHSTCPQEPARRHCCEPICPAGGELNPQGGQVTPKDAWLYTDKTTVQASVAGRGRLEPAHLEVPVQPENSRHHVPTPRPGSSRSQRRRMKDSMRL